MRHGRRDMIRTQMKRKIGNLGAYVLLSYRSEKPRALAKWRG